MQREMEEYPGRIVNINVEENKTKKISHIGNSVSKRKKKSESKRKKQWKQWLTIFWAPKSPQMVTEAMKLKDTPWKESYDKPRQHIKKQRHYFVNKGLSSQGYGFSCGHVWM